LGLTQEITGDKSFRRLNLKAYRQFWTSPIWIKTNQANSKATIWKTYSHPSYRTASGPFR